MRRLASSISGVYIIRSKSNPTRFYIGSSRHITRRWNDHRTKLRHGMSANYNLQEHYRLYGEEDLVYEILCPCPIEMLEEKEQFYFDTLSPTLNIIPISGYKKGKKIPKSCPWIESIRLAQTGRKHSAAELQKMRENSPLSKGVINIHTGIFYASITEAAMSTGKISPATLRAYLNGARKNKTSFRLIDNY